MFPSNLMEGILYEKLLNGFIGIHDTILEHCINLLFSGYECPVDGELVMTFQMGVVWPEILV